MTISTMISSKMRMTPRNNRLKNEECQAYLADRDAPILLPVARKAVLRKYRCKIAAKKEWKTGTQTIQKYRKIETQKHRKCSRTQEIEREKRRYV